MDGLGNVIGSLTLPDDTPEEVWEQRLAEYVPHVVTEEEKWEEVKKERASLFAETEWIKLRHRDQIDRGIPTSLTTEQYEAWLDYWQALRDIPENFTDPFSITWPTQPEV